jgi:hypothetical protein
MRRESRGGCGGACRSVVDGELLCKEKLVSPPQIQPPPTPPPPHHSRGQCIRGRCGDKGLTYHSPRLSACGSVQGIRCGSHLSQPPPPKSTKRQRGPEGSSFLQLGLSHVLGIRLPLEPLSSPEDGNPRGLFCLVLEIFISRIPRERLPSPSPSPSTLTSMAWDPPKWAPSEATGSCNQAGHGPSWISVLASP